MVLRLEVNEYGKVSGSGIDFMFYLNGFRYKNFIQVMFEPKNKRAGVWGWKFVG